MRPPSAARERMVSIVIPARLPGAPAADLDDLGARTRARVHRVPEYALKEWAVTVAALSRGDQVLVLRKGGIGEKRFEFPHRSFFLFPTYLHQRPELVKPEARAELAAEMERTEEPDRLPLRVYAE